ncbi:MAG: hypothetical protein ACT4PI_05820 [Actinomycetota bacterium]
MSQTLRAWASALALGIVLVIALEACSDQDMVTKPSKRPSEDFVPEATDFRNIHTMTPVREFFIDNRLGHLDEALDVANSPDGGEYPVGTIIQLVPQEAMVKRRAGFSEATGDWEFFFLSVSPDGTVIEVRGTDQVVNRFGGNCASCHALADPEFDFVCEQDHGCDPLTIGRDIINAVQKADRRPLT